MPAVILYDFYQPIKVLLTFLKSKSLRLGFQKGKTQPKVSSPFVVFAKPFATKRRKFCQAFFEKKA